MTAEKWKIQNREIDESDRLIAEAGKTEKQLVEQVVECRRTRRIMVERKTLLLSNDFQYFAEKSFPRSATCKKASVSVIWAEMFLILKMGNIKNEDQGRRICEA